MTAPGNSSLLLTLLAALIASTGYAGGRIHQWYRMGRDRDEAFRDGYDTATRSVFSLAARVISPRRADRAAIRASAGVVLPAESVVSSVIPIDIAAGSRSADRAARSAAPADGRAVRFPSRSPDRPVSPAAERNVRSMPVAAEPDIRLVSAAAPDIRSGSAAVASDVRFGSAAATPDVRFGSAAAVAPDVRFASTLGEETARVASAEQITVVGGGGRSAASGDRSPGAGSASGSPVGGSSAERRAPAGAEDAAESSGRHTVPDELVHAATYRLAPDRVARAKVHDSGSPVPVPDGKPRVAVPKPRTS